jgi:hypothetical protein
MALAADSPTEQHALARTSRWPLVLLVLLGAVLFAFLFTWRLDQYPTPWFDEGAYLNLARTYADQGIYAQSDIGGYQFNAAVLSVGPTVILPVSLVFKLFGVSIAGARLVMVLYGAITLFMVFLLARRLMPQLWAAWIAVLLAVFGWGNWMPLIYRTVMGEGPGMFFLFAALWLWFAPGKRPSLALTAVGLLLGLAAITKIQFALIIFPTIAIAALLDRLWYRARSWLYFVIPGGIALAIFAGWTAYTYLLLGADLRDPAADLAAVQAAGGASYLVFNFQAIAQNVLALTLGDSYGGLIIAGLLWSLVVSLRRDVTGQTWSTITLLILGGIVLYVATAGLEPVNNRGAVPVYMLGALALTSLLLTLANGLRFAPEEWITALRTQDRTPGKAAAYVLVAGLIIILIIVPLGRAAYNVLLTGSSAPYLTAQYLEANADPDSIIETWDREMPLLTSHRYHHPPASAQAYHNAHLLDPTKPSAGDMYHVLDELTPDYIVVGPMSYWAQLYSPQMLQDYELVFDQEDNDVRYQIYRHR